MQLTLFNISKPRVYSQDGQLRVRWELADGTLHREDGPADYEYSPQDPDGLDLESWTCGETRWYRYGQLHRIGGPAISNGLAHGEWFQDGKRHRTDGPACYRRMLLGGNFIYVKEYWIRGLQVLSNDPGLTL